MLSPAIMDYVVMPLVVVGTSLITYLLIYHVGRVVWRLRRWGDR